MTFKCQIYGNLEMRVEVFFVSIDGWKKTLDNVTNALTRDSATIGQIREDK